ncbi:unnamed protein product [Closterium sp. NIES-64]|nr:unnamed protein product [Closterium sp. NIES-64]
MRKQAGRALAGRGAAGRALAGRAPARRAGWRGARARRAGGRLSRARAGVRAGGARWRGTLAGALAGALACVLAGALASSLAGALAGEPAGSLVRPLAGSLVEALLDSIKWDDKGLVVAIAQHADTGAILMQGFANRDAVSATLASDRATFFSRSRKCLWTKGETSGHFINVLDMFIDCDRDTVRAGRAEDTEADELCHTLEGNEAGERAASEMADVLYHSMVLLAVKGVKMEDVASQLRRRFSMSGIDEKESVLYALEQKVRKEGASLLAKSFRPISTVSPTRSPQDFPSAMSSAAPSNPFPDCALTPRQSPIACLPPSQSKLAASNPSFLLPDLRPSKSIGSSFLVDASMQSSDEDHALPLSLSTITPPSSNAPLNDIPSSQQRHIDRRCFQEVDFFRPRAEPSAVRPSPASVAATESAPAFAPATVAAAPGSLSRHGAHRSAEATTHPCVDYSVVSVTPHQRLPSEQQKPPSAGRSPLLASSLMASVAEWSNVMMPPPATAGTAKSLLPGSSLANDLHRSVTALRRPTLNPFSDKPRGDAAPAPEAGDGSAKRPRCESPSHQLLPSLSSSTACTANIRDSSHPAITRSGLSNPAPPVPSKFSSAKLVQDIQKSARGDLSLDLPPPCCSWMCIYFSVPCRKKRRLAPSSNTSGRTNSVSAAVSGSMISGGGDSGVIRRRRAARPFALPASSGTSLSGAAGAPRNPPRQPVGRGGMKEEREVWAREDQSKASGSKGGAHLARCESANGGDSSVHGGLNTVLTSAFAAARGGPSAAREDGMFTPASELGVGSQPAGASASELLASYAASGCASPALRAFLALSPNLSALLNPSALPAADGASTLLRRLQSDSAAAAVAAATAARMHLLQQTSAAQQQQQQQHQQNTPWHAPAPLSGGGCGHSAADPSSDRVSGFIAAESGRDAWKTKALDLSLRL